MYIYIYIIYIVFKRKIIFFNIFKKINDNNNTSNHNISNEKQNNIVNNGNSDDNKNEENKNNSQKITLDQS